MVASHRMVRGLSHLSQILNPHRRRPRTRSGAPAWAAPRQGARVLRGALAAGILCATLGGCAGGFESTYSSGLWAEPGKYDYIKCPDMVRTSASLAAQEKRMLGLMAKADQEGAGPIINITVYQAQLEQIRAQARLLQRTAREKNCDLNAPAATNSPANAAAVPPPARPAPHR